MPLLLLSGTHEYDKEYWDDVDKLWKSAYGGFPREGEVTFAAFASAQIASSGILDEQNLPLISRQPILFWSLFVQLTMNVRFILTRSMLEAQSIQKAWDTTSTRNITAEASPTTVAATPTRRLFGSAKKALDCMICEESITGEDGITTPCKHSFHAGCLIAFTRGSATRKCPQCNFQEIGLPKGSPPRRRKTTVPQSPPHHVSQSGRPPRMKPPHRAVVSSQAEVVRSARLRRFEDRSSKAASTYSVATNDDEMFWTCSNCTFAENDLSFSSCSVCEVSRVDIPLAAHAASVSDWECQVCTLQNPRAADQCSACCAPNPFLSTAIVPFEPSHTTTMQQPRSVEAPLSPEPRRPMTERASERRVICGACGLQGHNRATATAATCLMYNAPAEVGSRAQKKAEAAAKAKERRDEAAQYDELTRRQIEQAHQQELEVRRILEITARQSEQFRDLTEKESARKKKAAERAEKRARRLAG